MDNFGITRREANTRLVAMAALAAGSGLALPRATFAQPGLGRSRLDTLMRRGRSKDWTLRVNVHVNSFQAANSLEVKIIPLKFDTAAVIFPTIFGTGSSETYPREFKGELWFDDRLAVPTEGIEYAENYQAGTRLAMWKVGALEGRELDLKVEIPMTCWETVFDERTGNEIEWPQTWPAAAASTLEPDPLTARWRGSDMPVLDTNDERIQALLKKWTNGKDPKTVKPVPLAKYLAGEVVEHVQISGNGLNFNRTGTLEGVDLQPASVTAETGRCAEHDAANFLATVYRAAGLPARTVIGYDLVDSKGEDSGFLGKGKSSSKIRSWVEFCLYDEGAQKELWVPVDIVRLRKASSRAQSLSRPWKYFGSHDELDDVLPFAFQYHPPTTVVAHGSPGFWGWLTTPQIQIADQALRFDATSTPRRAGDQERRERDRRERDARRP